MKIVDYTEHNIPGYALSYLVNGDSSGIDDEDQFACDEWLKACTEKLQRDYPGLTVDLILSDEGEASFTRYPAFGLACDCVEGCVVVWAENGHPLQRIALPWEEETEEEETEEEETEEEETEEA